MKIDFLPYKIGKVFNPVKVTSVVRITYRTTEIIFPSRLNAMAIDPSRITQNKNLVYTPGEILFSVGIYKRIRISIKGKEKNKLYISKNSQRKPLIKHAYFLMKEALNFKESLFINVDNNKEIRHCGLGSSSGLIAGVACAINEIYGKPLNKKNLVKYLAQNHGEEIDGDNKKINPVQCIGGSAAAGIFGGGLIVLAGESCLIKKINISPSYKVIIGIPKDFKENDSKILLKKEMKNFNKFSKTGKKFGKQIAYNVLHDLLPAMEEGNLEKIGEVIYNYRFNMGSINNCSFVYPKIVSLAEKLSFLKKKGLVDILTISSVGPAFFAVTKDISYCKKTFEKCNLFTIITKIENNGYSVIKNVK